MAGIAPSPLPFSEAEDQLNISVWCFAQIAAEHMDVCLQTRKGLPKAEGLCNTPPSTTAVSGGNQRPRVERATLRGSPPTPLAIRQSTTCSKQPGTRAKPCWDHQRCLEGTASIHGRAYTRSLRLFHVPLCVYSLLAALTSNPCIKLLSLACLLQNCFELT